MVRKACGKRFAQVAAKIPPIGPPCGDRGGRPIRQRELREFNSPAITSTWVRRRHLRESFSQPAGAATYPRQL